MRSTGKLLAQKSRTFAQRRNCGNNVVWQPLFRKQELKNKSTDKDYALKYAPIAKG